MKKIVALLVILTTTWPVAARERWTLHETEANVHAMSPLSSSTAFGESSVSVSCGKETDLLSIYIWQKSSESLGPQPDSPDNLERSIPTTAEWIVNGTASLAAANVSFEPAGGLIISIEDPATFARTLINATSFAIKFDTVRDGPVTIEYELEGAQETIRKIFDVCSWHVIHFDEISVAATPLARAGSIGTSRIVVRCSTENGRPSIPALGPVIGASITFASNPQRKGPILAKWDNEWPTQLDVFQGRRDHMLSVFSPKRFVERLARATSFSIRFDDSEHGLVTINYNLIGSKEALYETCGEV